MVKHAHWLSIETDTLFSQNHFSKQCHTLSFGFNEYYSTKHFSACLVKLTKNRIEWVSCTAQHIASNHLDACLSLYYDVHEHSKALWNLTDFRWLPICLWCFRYRFHPRKHTEKRIRNDILLLATDFRYIHLFIGILNSSPYYWRFGVPKFFCPTVEPLLPLSGGQATIELCDKEI